MFSIPGAYSRYVNNFLNKMYPRNFILNKPYTGTLIFFILSFCVDCLLRYLTSHISLVFGQLVRNYTANVDSATHLRQRPLGTR